jgi:hypothetical protein
MMKDERALIEAGISDEDTDAAQDKDLYTITDAQYDWIVSHLATLKLVLTNASKGGEKKKLANGAHSASNSAMQTTIANSVVPSSPPAAVGSSLNDLSF